MARRVFFSFHYERDISRANVVRNSWVTRDREAAGFFDASLWETTKLQGASAIERLIDRGMVGTSVTAVLIGAETATRQYVQYEIEQSIALGKGLFGIYINKIPNFRNETDAAAPNPLPAQYRTYGWNRDDGYANIGAWVESAARDAGS